MSTRGYFSKAKRCLGATNFGKHSSRLCGPGSSVGLETGYGLNGPGIESRWGAGFSAPVQTGPGPTQPPVQWVPGLSRGKERPGRDADPSPPSSAVVMKG